MKWRPLIALVPLLAAPVLAQPTDWRFYRDAFIGSAELTWNCGRARRLNAEGLSYWSSDLKKRVGSKLEVDGYSPDQIEAMAAGVAAAMAEACPSAW